MKNIIFLLFLILAGPTANAQTSSQQENSNLNPDQVPAAVVNSFMKEHPGITAIWKADGENFKAYYNDPDSKLGRMLIYDKDGKVTRVENEVDQVSFPNGIQDFYTKNYPGEKYQVWKSEDTRTGEKAYYSGRNMETIWFDEQGNKIPEKKAKK